MKNKYKTKINFFIDDCLIQEERSELLIRALHDDKIKYTSEARDVDNLNFTIIFGHKKNLRAYSKIKNRLVVLDSTEEYEGFQVEKLNYNSLEDIQDFIEKMLIIERRFLLQNKIRESEKTYEKLKVSNKEISLGGNFDFSVDHVKEMEDLLDLELVLLKEENLKNWNNYFKGFVKKNSALQSLIICNGQELFEEDSAAESGSLVLSLPSNGCYLLLKFKSNSFVKDSFYIEMLVTMFLRTIQIQDQQLIKSDGEIDFWKKIFSKIPYPMAVISKLGDLLIYNESFAKIGILPKECLRFKDQESLEIFKQFYKVRRIEFPINSMNVSYFVFYTSEVRDCEIASSNRGSGTRKASVDELGIISSSIAHELNNPLAGILAALSLLSLEDGWTSENLIDLDDMKNGAKRCKELVDIFLGFSKFAPVSGDVPSIKGSLDQAINLLRFRMIESNLRLDMKYHPTLESFNHQINSSILSMIFYLILSELMTAFAHERLISDASVSAMRGEVLELSNQIVMKLDYDFEYEEKLAQSKLIQHLLVFEKLEINFLSKEIRLIYRS